MRTRSIIIIGALIVVLLGVAGFELALVISHANAGSASVTATPTTAPTVVATTPTKNKKGNKKYTGVIQSLGTNSFVLMETGKKAKSITIMVDAQTTYSGPNGGISFSNLQVGENVTVKGTLDNQSQAVTASAVMVASSGNATPTP